MPPPVPLNCPILVWVLSLNREYTKEEYDEAFELVKETMPDLAKNYEPENPDNFRQILGRMLPMLMMRHRRIPRARWKDHVTGNNKHWIEQTHEDMHPEKYMHSMIGYCLAPEQSIIGMAMTQGRQKHVVTIGLGLKQISTFPYGTSISTYCESYAHKLTPLEQSFISPDLADDVRLRRLCIVISLKAAYIRAIGQPSGFDWSRLEFNVPQSTAKGDGHPLGGWEFRIWKTQVGVERKDTIVEESYQCACAFFRGSEESTFIWEENTKDLESWVQYLTLDQLLKVIPKLSA